MRCAQAYLQEPATCAPGDVRMGSGHTHSWDIHRKSSVLHQQSAVAWCRSPPLCACIRDIEHDRPAQVAAIQNSPGTTGALSRNTTCGTGTYKRAMIPQSRQTISMHIFSAIEDVAPSTSSRMPIFQHPVCHSALLLQIRKDASAIGSRTRRVRLLL